MRRRLGRRARSVADIAVCGRHAGGANAEHDARHQGCGRQRRSSSRCARWPPCLTTGRPARGRSLDECGRGVQQLDSGESARRWTVCRPTSEPSPTATSLAATACLDRINGGIEILRTDERARKAFRLANLAMLLQQIATEAARETAAALEPGGRQSSLRKEPTTRRGISTRRTGRRRPTSARGAPSRSHFF